VAISAIKVISGGQTGVDRAALDVAIDLGLPHGGTCPKGRKAEDGCIPEHYQLTESNAPHYPARTRQNIKDSHGTCIIHCGGTSKGTQLTQRLCTELKKPFLMVDARHIHMGESHQDFLDFLEFHFITIVNVAGPRASTWNNGYQFAFQYLKNNFTSHLAR
jgi:hypothetical protein